MSDTSSTNTTTPVTPAVKTPRDNAIQSKAIADGNASAELLIKTVLSSPALLSALDSSGYNQTTVGAGLELFTVAQSKFEARQTSMATYESALAARKKVHEAAKKRYKSYRRTVQLNFKGPIRANLGASGRVPSDHDKFRTNARTAYTTALTSPQLGELSKYGLTPERLNEALATLDALTTAETVLQNATSAAQAATDVRDTAADVLKTWVSKLRGIAKDALEDKPELLSLMSA